MVSPFTVEVKGVGKLFDILKSYFGVRLIRPAAREQAEARILAAQADAKVRLIAARAEIDEKKIYIKGQHEIRELEQQLRGESLPAFEEDVIDVVWEDVPVTAPGSRASQGGLFENVDQKRFKNIKRVTVETLKSLPEQQECSDDPVDPDWYARFFDNVKDVSHEDLQTLWGKLLAGEIARPGKFSLRTLDTLRNLTSQEAQLFYRCLQFCTDDAEIVVLHNMNASKESDVKVGDLRLLVECGLLHTQTEFMLGNFEKSDSMSLPFRGKLIRISSPPTPRFLTGISYRLTRAGVELGNLRFPDADEQFIHAICELAERHSFNVEIVTDPLWGAGDTASKR